MDNITQAVIFCGGYVSDYEYCREHIEPRSRRYVICADGGGLHARRLNVLPDILLGDMDSINPIDYEYFVDNNVKIHEYPKNKDKTDSEIAVEFAVDMGFDEISIFGGTGSRLDHSLANIMLLGKIAEAGITAQMLDASNEAVAICPANGGRLTVKRSMGVKLSLFALSEIVEGVTTNGLLYPLDGAVLIKGSTWGVSNEFTADVAEITIRSGTLLVVKTRDVQ